MIVDTHGIWHARDVLFKNPGDFSGIISHIKSAGAGVITGIIGFHGLVQHYFLAFISDFHREALRMGKAWQD